MGSYFANGFEVRTEWFRKSLATSLLGSAKYGKPSRSEVTEDEILGGRVRRMLEKKTIKNVCLK